jgi:hypothetical protein
MANKTIEFPAPSATNVATGPNIINGYTTIENLLHNISIWGSEAGGLVARLGYSRQGSQASNRLS